MEDEILDQVGLYYLGHTWFQAGDIGEVLETMSRVDPSDVWSWSREWIKTAERLEVLGDESVASGELKWLTTRHLRPSRMSND